MTRYLCNIVAVLMMCLLCQAANAAPYIQSYRFTALTQGPIASFVGTAKIELDEDSGQSRLLAFDLAMPDRVFTAANVALDTYLGANVILLRSINYDAPTSADVLGPNKGYDGFLLAFIRPDLSQGNFGYTLANDPDPDNEEGYGYRRVTLELVPTVVPEPATWALMLLGFAAIGMTIRRRSQRLAVVTG